MQRSIARLHGHFVICAYGRVGRAVAREFIAEGIAFAVIDPKAEARAQLEADGALYLEADPTKESALRQAGIDRARGLVCAVDSDADNVYITLTAREINPRLFIVARASDPDSPERLYRAGADRVISPYVSSGRHMAMLALRPRVVDYLDIMGRGEAALRLEEVLIESGSPFIGATVGDVCGDALALVLRRGDGTLEPNPPRAHRVAAGDLVVALGERRPGGSES